MKNKLRGNSKKATFNSPRIIQQLKGSPRPKFKSSSLSTLTSPTSHTTLLIQTSKNQKTQSQKDVEIWAPEKEIGEDLQRFRVGFMKQLQINTRLSQNIEKSQYIVTKIDDFMSNFIHYQEQKQWECIIWFIVSPAMNSEQIQTNFNSMYSPLKFKFIHNLNELYNYLIHGCNPKTAIYPSLVVSQSSNLYDSYICIQELTENQIQQKGYKHNYVYLFFEKYAILNAPQNASPYFIQNGDQFGENGQMLINVNPQKAVFLILDRASSQKLKQIKISRLQTSFKTSKAYRQILLFPHYQHNYANKMVKHLSQNVIIVPSSFHIRTKHCLLKQTQRFNIVLISSECFQFQNTSQYITLTKQQAKQYNQITVTQHCIEEDVPKVLNYISEYTQIVNKLISIKSVIKKTIIYLFQQSPTTHPLAHLLHSIQVTPQYINSLQHLYETHKIIIIVGNLTYAHMQLIQHYHNVFAIPYNQQQLSQAHTFIDTIQNAYNKYYSDLPSIKTYLDIITNNEQTCLKLQNLFNISKESFHLYTKNQFILNLNSFEQLTKHVIIINIDEFTEDLEKAIRNIVWNNQNYISIQLYVKYAQQFIYMNRQGLYKFIKLSQLKSIISSLHENHELPLPYSIPPEPITEEQIKSSIIEEREYQLYICVHRSVPYHSLMRRNKKVYHLLVYNKLEEILFLSKHLKQSEKIYVIANVNSQEIYESACSKLQINRDKLIITYVHNPSQKCIRKHIDIVLHSNSLKVNAEQVKQKKFKVLILYDNKKEKHLKIVKATKKIFSFHLKIQFISWPIYQQLLSHSIPFQISPNIKTFSLGSETNCNFLKIRSVKELFILAMHPDLQSVELQTSHISIPIEVVMNKMIKDEAKTKVLDRNEKGIKKMKSESHFPKQCRMTQKQSRKTIKMRSVQKNKKGFTTNLNSSIKHMGQQYPFTIIQSRAITKNDKYNTFGSELQLQYQVIQSQQNHHLTLVLLSQSEFDTYEIFQSSRFTSHRGIIWIIITKNKAKSVFLHTNVTFCLANQVNQFIDLLHQQYSRCSQFSCLKVTSVFDNVQTGTFSSEHSNHQRTLSLNVEAQEVRMSRILPQNSITFVLSNSAQSKSDKQKVYYFPSLMMIKQVLNRLINRFTLNNQMKSSQIRGAVLICPSSSEKSIIKIIKNMNNHNIVLATYSEKNIFQILTRYYFMRTILLVHKNHKFQKLSNAIPIQENSHKMANLLHLIIQS